MFLFLGVILFRKVPYLHQPEKSEGKINKSLPTLVLNIFKGKKKV